MSNTAITIRNYRPGDFDEYVRLHIRAGKLESAAYCVSPQGIAEQLDRPNHSPEQDLFIAELDEHIIGYMDITPELSIGRVVLDCWVQPEHRRKGMATKLLSQVMRRARELGVKVAHVNIMEGNPVAQRALPRLGFSLVRRFLELQLDMTNFKCPDNNRVASDWRYLQHGEEDKLAQIQNRAFAGSWGFNPNTEENIRYQTSLSSSSPEDIIIICEDSRITGYCWTGIVYETGATGEKKGRIFMLGVDPDYRGQNIGKRILLAGLSHLKSKNLRIIELTMDSENKAAYALYRSFGFRVKKSGLWYERAINQETGAR